MTPLEISLTKSRDLEREALDIVIALKKDGTASELDVVRQRIALEHAERDLFMFAKDEEPQPISDAVRQCVEIALDPESITVGDESPCLPSWLETFDKAFRSESPVNLSPNAAATLYHTLLAAKCRTSRLVRERDAAKENSR